MRRAYIWFYFICIRRHITQDTAPKRWAYALINLNKWKLTSTLRCVCVNLEQLLLFYCCCWWWSLVYLLLFVFPHYVSISLLRMLFDSVLCSFIFIIFYFSPFSSFCFVEYVWYSFQFAVSVWFYSITIFIWFDYIERWVETECAPHSNARNKIDNGCVYNASNETYQRLMSLLLFVFSLHSLDCYAIVLCFYCCWCNFRWDSYAVI